MERDLQPPFSPIRARRAYCPSELLVQRGGEHQIDEAFHLPPECFAVAVPPDLLHLGQTIRVHMLDSHHFLQTENAVSAAQPASLYSPMRSFADAEAGDGIVHHDRACLD